MKLTKIQVIVGPEERLMEVMRLPGDQRVYAEGIISVPTQAEEEMAKRAFLTAEQALEGQS